MLPPDSIKRSTNKNVRTPFAFRQVKLALWEAPLVFYLYLPIQSKKAEIARTISASAFVRLELTNGTKTDIIKVGQANRLAVWNTFYYP